MAAVRAAEIKTAIQIKLYLYQFCVVGSVDSRFLTAEPQVRAVRKKLYS